jgi:long-chain fatty acid transport protein
MRSVGRAAVWLGSAAVVLAAASAAQAGGFAIREQSACGQGVSFAGVAAGCSLSSMFWNPATLSAVEAFEAEAVGTGVFINTEVDIDPFGPFPATSQDDIAQDAFVPAGYAAYRFNDRLVLGIGVNSPFGLVTQYDSTSPVHISGVAGTSKVFSLNANPAISYDVTDWLSIAAGAQVQYVDVRLTRQALGPLGVSTIEGDDFAFGFTAGLHLRPVAGTEIGLGYRSFIDHELEGDLSTGLGVFDVSAEGLDLPDLVTLGIRQRITDRFRVMAGAEWSNWSRFEEINVSGAPAPIELPFEYDDGWFFSVGGEYDVTPEFAVRAGIGYELSPLDEGNRTFRLPDDDRLWLSAGASYKPNDRWSFDVGYSFLTTGDIEIRSAADGGPIANGPFSGEADSNVHIISAAVKVKFGGPPAPAIITK